MSFYLDSTVNLISFYIETLKKRPKLRLWMTIITFVLFVCSLILGIFSRILFYHEIAETLKSILLVLATAFFLSFVSSIAAFTDIKVGVGGLEIELKSIRSEREKIKKRLSQKSGPNIFNTVQLSLNQLTEYYTINKSQARNSYRWSVFGMVVGLATLLFGLWLVFFQENPEINIAIISGISGVLIEFLSATNFYIYKKSIKQLNYFFEELIKMQDTMLAIDLCDGLDDKTKKLELKEFIIKSLVQRSSNQIPPLD